MASGNASTSVVLLFELIKNHRFQQNRRTMDPGFFQNLKELMVFKKRTINELVVGLMAVFLLFFFPKEFENNVYIPEPGLKFFENRVFNESSKTALITAGCVCSCF
jgi:hypothetical protein